MSIGEALKICGFSIATVFVVLFCIELLIKIFAWAIERKTEKANKDAAKTDDPITDIPVQAEDTVTPAIVAAIAFCLDKSPDQFIVRSIHRIDEESTWARNARTNSLR